MAVRPNFPALAHAIAIAAGRMAHGATPVQSVVDRLTADLVAAWPEPAPVDTKHRHDTGAGVWEHSHAGGDDPHFSDPAHLLDAVRAPSDTPAMHLAWTSNLLEQMSRDRLDVAQLYAIDEALRHLARAAELISDEVWADVDLDSDPDAELPGRLVSLAEDLDNGSGEDARAWAATYGDDLRRAAVALEGDR